MILRADSDREQLTVLGNVLADGRLDPDTRCLLAGLLADRSIENFPLIADLGPAARMTIGPERARRMFNQMRRAGYLVRAFWKVPYRGRRPAYSSICGAPELVVVAVSQFALTMRPGREGART
ncbi:MAG TPA: hypothetical protein VNR39_12455 [Pseudolabrys sp.]|nr:hypothetical protein [Pseudolabrys sp.]